MASTLNARHERLGFDHRPSLLDEFTQPSSGFLRLQLPAAEYRPILSTDLFKDGVELLELLVGELSVIKLFMVCLGLNAGIALATCKRWPPRIR
jgi:hypothetical protein